MKTEKIVSLNNYRTEHHGGKHTTREGAAGFCLPSVESLWKLLDRNISIAVWRELTCA